MTAADAAGPEMRLRLDHVVDRLTEEFAGVVGHDTVERCVTDGLRAYADARVATYVPVLVHRFARQQLRAIAIVRGAVVKERPEVLLACQRNAGRSQVAAALLRHYVADRAHVTSAGSTPASEVDEGVVAVLTERGIVVDDVPKPFTDEMVQAADVVVTMGCGEACPVFPGKRYLDWPVADPADAPVEEVRRIVDDIDARVRALAAELVPDRLACGQPKRPEM
jgi:protein-tyrosine-phosphatase